MYVGQNLGTERKLLTGRIRFLQERVTSLKFIISLIKWSRIYIFALYFSVCPAPIFSEVAFFIEFHIALGTVW